MGDISGHVQDGFERVAEEFGRNFDERGDVGAGVAVYVDGECVVDLTGGTTTEGGDTPYGPRHLQLVYSTTKAATAACAHLLAQRGQLDLDAPVVQYWPEFAAQGKHDVPVSWLLSHRVGLPDVDRLLSLEEALAWDPVVEALAASVPVWEPGTQHGYHAMTFGWLVGELVRRVSGRSLGTFFAEEIAAPLGLEFWIGTPDEVHDRVVPMIAMGPPEGLAVQGDSDGRPPGLVEMLDQLLGPGNLVGRALSAPGGAFTEQSVWNTPELWRAELGAANGITNARSLARFYASLVGEVDGVRILSEATVRRAIEPQVSGPDAVLMFAIPFGLGFMREAPGMLTLGGPGGFGHYGAGGSVGLGDIDRGIAIGYVMNKMQLGLAGDPRSSSLIAAVNDCVG